MVHYKARPTGPHAGERLQLPQQEPPPCRRAVIPSGPDDATGEPPHPTPPWNPWFVASVASLAGFMEVLDTSIANVALPHIAGSLAVSLDESTWVLTTYLVANVIVLPISGWISNTIGRKPFFMAAIALFTLSSVLCGMAPDLSSLIFFRVLQGLGGGGLAPVALAILVDSFPPRKRGMAMSIYGVTVLVAPILGPRRRRLDHRQLYLAMDLLHQSPRRHRQLSSWSDMVLERRSTHLQNRAELWRQAAADRLRRLRAAGRRPGRRWKWSTTAAIAWTGSARR